MTLSGGALRRKKLPDARCGSCSRRSRGPAACLVRPPSPRAALARARGGAQRSLSGLAVGDHAAADDGEGGRAVFREIRRALADGRCAGPGFARRRAPHVGGARLLLACAQPACLRRRGDARARRTISRQRRRPARASRCRSLYGCGDRSDRVRSPDHAGGRQHRAGGVAAVCGRGRTAEGEAAHPGAGANAFAGRAEPATPRRR